MAQSFSYDGHDKLASGTGETAVYDANGSLTSDTLTGQTFAYDDEDRLVSASGPGYSDTFSYNGLGLRVAKTDSTGSYSYLCDGTSPASPVLWDGHAIYTPGLSERRGGSSAYYANDRLGNLWTLDGAGKSQVTYEDTTGFGSLTAGSRGPTPFGFGGGNGCQTDLDTGLVLMGHRYYDTRIGRFITQDPAQVGGNWYAYCKNNPVNASDPTGLETIFNVPGGWSQAQVEAYTASNYGDGTYSVAVRGEHIYTFTIQTQSSNNSGWGLGLGVAFQFIAGGYNHNRNYGPTSTQAINMRNSSGYKDVLSQIAAGQKSGGVGTAMAAVYSFYEYLNGTQAQLGAFAWRFTNPNNSNMGIDILNDITYNSLAYHIPGMLNNLGVPNPKAYLDILNGGSPTGQFATNWPSGNFGTIHQKIHINFP